MKANVFKSHDEYLLDVCEMLVTVDVDYRSRKRNLDMCFGDLLTEFHVYSHNIVYDNEPSRKRQRKNYEGNERKIRRRYKPYTSLTTKQPFTIPTAPRYGGIRSRRKISIMDCDVIRYKSLQNGSNLNTYKMTSVAEAEEIEAAELFYNSIKNNLRVVDDDE